MFYTIKQLEEKSCSAEITDMLWSDRMDLVALANSKGEVSLHRLTWSRAWVITSPKKNVNVDGMAWRPDGKVIAIAYSTGKVFLISVENKAVLRILDLNCSVACIHWVQEKIEPKTVDPRLSSDSEELNDFMKYIDTSPMYLSEPPSTVDESASVVTEENKKPHVLHNQNELNLLLIGTKEGNIFIHAFGCYQCVNLNLSDHLGYKCSVENILLTEDLSNMFVTVRDCNDYIKIICIDSSIFKTHSRELFAVALKHVRLQHLVEYMANTISTIKETWESILLEMDTKLSNYASKVAEGAVTADFLDLLMFGICSSELEEFLLKDLTKKGLEKFGQTIEVSYCNIQKLLLKFLIKYGQNITYHLSELRGMARLDYRYGVFGISEGLVTEAIQSSGLYLIKGCEVQQIINQSVINYKAFIRWLYTAIMHLMDEEIPAEIPKMTQQDLAYIIEFLQNFDHIGHKDDSSKKRFVMERIGQYLSEEPLTIPPNMEGNEWTKFLEQNQCVRENPHILKHCTNMSLIQQYNYLKESIEKVFNQSKNKVGEQLKISKVYSCFKTNQSKLKMTQLALNKDTIVYAFVQPPHHIDLMQMYKSEIIKYGKYQFPQHLSYEQESYGDNYEVLDAKFYSNLILSLLLQETNTAKTPVIYQLSLIEAANRLDRVITEGTIVETNSIDILNGSNVFPKLFKSIDGMVASQFAVSGSRRVSVVLADNKRRIKLFEMEGEEEDDEDADMTSSTIRESDVSMHESAVE